MLKNIIDINTNLGIILPGTAIFGGIFAVIKVPQTIRDLPEKSAWQKSGGDREECFPILIDPEDLPEDLKDSSEN